MLRPTPSLERTLASEADMVPPTNNAEFGSSLKCLSDAQLLRLIYSTWDFQQALSAVTFLLEDCDYGSEYDAVSLRRLRCYEATAIISFCRPLEPARGSTILGLRALGVRLASDEEKLKERITQLRRKVVAHSDEDAMLFLAEIVQPLDDFPYEVPNFQFKESLYLAEAEAHDLQHLLRKLLHRMTDELLQMAHVAPQRLINLSRTIVRVK